MQTTCVCVGVCAWFKSSVEFVKSVDLVYSQVVQVPTAMSAMFYTSCHIAIDWGNSSFPRPPRDTIIAFSYGHRLTDSSILYNIIFL